MKIGLNWVTHFMLIVGFLFLTIPFTVEAQTKPNEGIVIKIDSQTDENQSGLLSVRYQFSTKGTPGLSGPVKFIFNAREFQNKKLQKMHSFSQEFENVTTGIKSGTFNIQLVNSSSDKLTVIAVVRKPSGIANLIDTRQDFDLTKLKTVSPSSTPKSTPSGVDTGANPSATASPQTSCSPDSPNFVNGQFCRTLFGDNLTASQYFLNFYRWAVGIAIIGAAVAIVFAGYKYALSRGNPSEISSAKEIIASAIVGLVLLLLSFTIVRFLGINVV